MYSDRNRRRIGFDRNRCRSYGCRFRLSQRSIDEVRNFAEQ